MKHSLPNLNWGVVLLAACQLAASCELIRAAEISGSQLLAEAATRLVLQPGISAKIRLRGLLLDQELVGSGTYQQILSEGRTRIRLELKLQVDERQTTLLQVNDGVVLWSRRDDDPRRAVQYVNLRLVREAARRAGTELPASTSLDSLAIGGLPQLLQGLDRHLDIAPPVEDTIANVPVWSVRGSWKKERLAALLPERKEQLLSGGDAPAGLLPAHLPEFITVMLGRDDFIPLFPYRIEYSRREAPNPSEAAGRGRAGEVAQPVRTILVMELFEVRREWEFDPRAFEYRPGTQHVENNTDAYLQRLGLAGK